MNIYWMEFAGILLFVSGWLACRLWSYLGTRPMSNVAVSRMIADTSGDKYESYVADVRGALWDLRDDCKKKAAPDPEPKTSADAAGSGTLVEGDFDAFETQRKTFEAQRRLMEAQQRLTWAQQRAAEWAATPPRFGETPLPSTSPVQSPKRTPPGFGYGFGTGTNIGISPLNRTADILNEFSRGISNISSGGYLMHPTGQKMVYTLSIPPEFLGLEPSEDKDKDKES